MLEVEQDQWALQVKVLEDTHPHNYLQLVVVETKFSVLTLDQQQLEQVEDTAIQIAQEVPTISQTTTTSITTTDQILQLSQVKDRYQLFKVWINKRKMRKTNQVILDQ